MLASALGRGAAAAGRERRKQPATRVVSEAYPESEFAAAAGGGGRTADDDDGGGGELRLSDLVAGLGEAKGKLGANRKLLERLDKKGAPIEAPLPRAVRERQERRAGYEETSKDVTKWQPIVKVSGGCVLCVLCAFVCVLCASVLYNARCVAHLACKPARSSVPHTRWSCFHTQPPRRYVYNGHGYSVPGC